MNEDTYITPPTYLPALGSVALLSLMVGLGKWLHQHTDASYYMVVGIASLVVMIILWFSTVIHENRTFYSDCVHEDRSFRIGMLWFIFTEIMFFFAFFGVLFYIRIWALPVLSGEVMSKVMTHEILWPSFKGTWPLLTTPNPSLVKGPSAAMSAAGIPFMNTLILLLSGLTITLSHHNLVKSKHHQSILWMISTIILGWIFLYFQMIEYGHAFHQGLTLNSGIYGNIFFIMTGFHGLHVFIGSVILLVIAVRMWKGHFTKKSHFAFEASAWYWHFVDVVWLALFVFVYWI